MCFWMHISQTMLSAFLTALRSVRLSCYIGIFIARSLCAVHCLGLTHWFLIAAPLPLLLPLPFGLSDKSRSSIIQYCSLVRRSYNKESHAYKSFRCKKNANERHRAHTEWFESSTQNYRRNFFSFPWFVYCCCAISFSILYDLAK